MATELVSVFSGSVPFCSRFPLHIWENLSISSSILKTTSKHVQHVPYFMLFYVVLRYIFISVPHTASTVPSRTHIFALRSTQAPSWLVSSVGRALHRYRRGHGFKSRTGLNFFRSYFQLLFQ